jgi:hypothetical protein
MDGGGNSRLEHVHCSWCGSENMRLKGSKGKFRGNVGSMLAIHECRDCGRRSNILITGDDFFPERGFGVGRSDYNIKFA